MKQKYDYEDFVRPYNRIKQVREITDRCGLVNIKIAEAERNIKIMKIHLREGVEPKEKKEEK